MTNTLTQIDENKVYIKGYGTLDKYARTGVVSKTTKTQIHVNVRYVTKGQADTFAVSKFRRSDGYRVGDADAWSGFRILELELARINKKYPVA